MYVHIYTHVYLTFILLNFKKKNHQLTVPRYVVVCTMSILALSYNRIINLYPEICNNLGKNLNVL